MIKKESKMEILSEEDFEFFKELIRKDREGAKLALRIEALIPKRRIKVKTDKWRVIIDEEMKLTRNGKFYVSRKKDDEIIFGKKYLYLKFNNKLKTITPFNKVYSGNLITPEEVFDYYNLDFFKLYSRYLLGNKMVSLAKIKKHKITNFEQLFKLTWEMIPYAFFRKNMQGRNFDHYGLMELNNVLRNVINPNAIFNFSVEDLFSLLRNHIFLDMIRMARMLDKKINILWSKKRIKFEHDKYSKEILYLKKKFLKKEKLNVNNVFRDIFPSPKYELIDNTLRLFEEGDEMKHCVYSSGQYLKEVNNGNCGIYSITHNNEKYTLDLRYNKNKTFKISQLRGFKNKNYPKELHDELNTIISNYNEKNGNNQLPANNNQVVEANHADLLNLFPIDPFDNNFF